MAAPIFAEFPPAPSRSEGQEDFSETADAFAAALPPFALKMNLAITWMADTMTATSGYKDAAAASANLSSQAAVTSAQARDAALAAVTAATQAGAAQVALAAQQVALAVAAKDTAQTYAVAAGASSGVGQLGNSGDALVVNATRTGMMFAPASNVGDILISAVTPGPLYVPANGGIRAQSALPSLFGILGRLGGQIGQQYLAVSPGNTSAGVIDIASASSLTSKIPMIMQIITGSLINLSLDGGMTWVQKDASASITNVNSLNYDESRRLWIATNSSGLLYTSADDGTTWITALNQPVVFGRVIADTNGVWLASPVAANTSIYRSTDAGVTWTAIATGASAIHTAISTDNKGVWCVCAGTTVRRSADGGLTWTISITAGSTVGSISNDRNGTWMVGVSVSSTGILRSVDNGLTFYSLTIATAVVTDIAYTQGFFFIVRSVSPQLMMISSAPDVTTFTIPTAAVLASLSRVTATAGYVVAANSANATVLRSAPIFAYDPNTQLQLPNLPTANGLQAWIKAGLISASTGKTFTLVASNIYSSVSDMASDENGVIIAVGTNGTIRRSADYGVTWVTIANPSGLGQLSSVATNGRGLWIIGGISNILRSTDNGVTFVAVTGHGLVGTISQVVIGRNDVTIACLSTAVIPRKSTDGGLTWASTGLTAAVSRACTDGAGNWLIGQGAGSVFRSADNSSTFSAAIVSGLLVAITDIKMTKNGVAYLCGASTSAKKSTDYGVTWSALSLPAAGLKFATGNTNIVMLYGVGVSRTTLDGGLTWTTIDPAANSSIVFGGTNSPFSLGSGGGSLYTATSFMPI
ncbi:MAG TPA: hypothetical protein VF682_25925 [Pseudomonas sp.]|jgi:photosystem II stability/assembly factor-like uncharacterized protein